jgi:hypothetical protein
MAPVYRMLVATDCGIALRRAGFRSRVHKCETIASSRVEPDLRSPRPLRTTSAFRSILPVCPVGMRAFGKDLKGCSIVDGWGSTRPVYVNITKGK